MRCLCFSRPLISVGIVASLTLVLILGFPRSVRADDASWVGKTILTKEAGIRISHMDEKGQQVYVATLKGVGYKVLDDKSGLIQVKENGVEGWFDKKRFFRQTRASALENVDMVPSHGVTTTDSPRGKRMSTSLLYHAFGIVGYHYVSQHFQEGRVNFRIEQPRERLRCSQCGCAEVWMRGHHERTFRTVPIGSKPTSVTLAVARVWCPVCETVRQVKVGFADPKKRYTRSFERYALELSRHMTIKDVAEHLQVSWDTIKDIQAPEQPPASLWQAQAAQAPADRH